MNWFATYDKYIHIISDSESDPYRGLEEDLTDESIVWSVLRRARIDDGYFNAALVAFDAWTTGNPSIRHKITATSIIYKNLVII